jgi:circadian clock protein KaiB
LYITAETPNSIRALANIKRICEEELGNAYDLEVIDILKTPQLAEDDKIIAIPTLIKKLPVPIRRLVGDLSDREQVLAGLDIVRRYNGGRVSDPQEIAAKPQEDLQQQEALT